MGGGERRGGPRGGATPPRREGTLKKVPPPFVTAVLDGGISAHRPSPLPGRRAGAYARRWNRVKAASTRRRRPGVTPPPGPQRARGPNPPPAPLSAFASLGVAPGLRFGRAV